MTPSQVARLLAVSADTVRAWADAGQLACIRTTAGHRLFRRNDVERFARTRPVRQEFPLSSRKAPARQGSDG
jgi:excisionase family DNA binding protein